MVFHSQEPLQPINKTQRVTPGRQTLSQTAQSTPVGAGDSASMQAQVHLLKLKKESYAMAIATEHEVFCLSSHPSTLTDKTVVRCLNKQSILSQTIDFSLAIKPAACGSQ